MKVGMVGGRWVVALLLLTSTAATGAEPTFIDAEQAFRSLDYVTAIATATALLKRGRNEPQALRRIYALLGQANAITGEEHEAQSYFRLLLALDPSFRLPPTTSPKVRTPLSTILADWAGRPGLTIAHSPPSSALCDRPLVLRLSVVEDPLAMVRGAAVSYQLPRKRTWSAVRAAGGRGEVALTLPLAPASAGGTLHYYLDVLDEHDNVLLRKGQPEAPLSVELVAGPSVPAPAAPVAKAAATPWYKRWWIWTLAGVVIGGATAAAIVTTSQPGTSTLEMGWEVKPAAGAD